MLDAMFSGRNDSVVLEMETELLRAPGGRCLSPGKGFALLA